MVNEKLLKVSSPEIFIKMGFTENHDGSEDPRGTYWTIKNDKFTVLIDAWCEVKLNRNNPDTDSITIHVDTLFELECVVDWIKD